MNKDIYRKIKNRILFLEYAPGTILNENVLAKEFGVSRTPMREVLYRLEWEQLARIIPRTGTMVTEIEFQKMMHVFQARLGIEGELGRLAAELATGRHIEQIQQIRSDCVLLKNRKDVKGLADIDSRFRAVLQDAAGNPVLKDVSNHLYTLAFRLWYVTMDKGEWDQEVLSVLTEIDVTLECLDKKDAGRGALNRRESLIRHFDRIRTKFLGIPSEVKL